jgi:hypothetical protein
VDSSKKTDTHIAAIISVAVSGVSNFTSVHPPALRLAGTDLLVPSDHWPACRALAPSNDAGTVYLGPFSLPPFYPVEKIAQKTCRVFWCYIPVVLQMYTTKTNLRCGRRPALDRKFFLLMVINSLKCKNTGR